MKLLLIATTIFSAIMPPNLNATDLPNTVISPPAYDTSMTRMANNDSSITYVNSSGGSVRYYRIQFNYVNELSAIEEQISDSNVSYFTLPLNFYNYEPNANMGPATLSILADGVATYNLTNELSILAPDTLFAVHSLNSIPYFSYLEFPNISFVFIIPTYDTTPRAGYNDFEIIKNNNNSFWYYNHNAFIKRFEETPLPPIQDGGFFDGLFAILEKGFNSIRNILSIPLFPGITLGTLLFLPLLFAIAYTLIKFLLGGG